MSEQKPVDVYTVQTSNKAIFDRQLEEWLGRGYALIGYQVVQRREYDLGELWYVATLAKRNGDVDYLPEAIVDNRPTMD